jgi:SMC interacting uncharacterized protein involved in chromosome segregation
MHQSEDVAIMFNNTLKVTIDIQLSLELLQVHLGEHFDDLALLGPPVLN